MEALPTAQKGQTKKLLHVYSYICGYHEYLSIWDPKVDEMYALKQEPQNKEHSNALAIIIVHQKI